MTQTASTVTDVVEQITIGLPLYLVTISLTPNASFFAVSANVARF